MKQQLLEKPTRTVNFASFFITKDDQPGMLSRRPAPKVRLKTHSAAPSVQLAQPRTRRGARLAAITERKLPVERVSGRMSRAFGDSLQTIGSAELKIPGGMPRFVNAATLKRMLRAAPSDTLLKRSGAQWEICENSTRIDLLDDSVEFRLGTIQVFS